MRIQIFWILPGLIAESALFLMQSFNDINDLLICCVSLIRPGSWNWIKNSKVTKSNLKETLIYSLIDTVQAFNVKDEISSSKIKQLFYLSILFNV